MVCADDERTFELLKGIFSINGLRAAVLANRKVVDGRFNDSSLHQHSLKRQDDRIAHSTNDERIAFNCNLFKSGYFFTFISQDFCLSSSNGTDQPRNPSFLKMHLNLCVKSPSHFDYLFRTHSIKIF